MSKFIPTILATLCCMLLASAGLGGCDRGDRRAALVESSRGNAERGRAALIQYSCNSCHTIPGIGSAKNLSGPPLHDLARRAYLGGNLPNTPSNLMRWITDPQGIVPATTMPDLGVSDAEARDMAAYLFGRST